jgi:pyruvate dehydrogenase (quinone)
VISLLGEGGVTMLMGDLITLVQITLPVKIVIFHHGVLGFVALEMKASGFIGTGVDLQNSDFAAMARAMLDVVVARQELSMPASIGAAEIKGFGVRAVMGGRGDEVLGLATTNWLGR